MADFERRSSSPLHRSGESEEPLGWNPTLGSRGNLDFFRTLTIPDKHIFLRNMHDIDENAVWRQMIDDWSKYPEGKRALAAYSHLLPFHISHPEVGRALNRFCHQALDDPDIDTTLQLHTAASVEKGFRMFSTPRDTSPQARLFQRANKKIREADELLAKKYIKSETYLVNAEETPGTGDDLGINAIVEKLQEKTQADFLSIDVDPAEPVNGKKRLVVRWVNMPKDYQEGARLLVTAYEICPDVTPYQDATADGFGALTGQVSRYSYAYLIMQNWDRMLEFTENDNSKLHYCWQVATHVAATAPDAQKLSLANDWSNYAGFQKAQPGTIRNQNSTPANRIRMNHSHVLDGILMPDLRALQPPPPPEKSSLYHLDSLVNHTLSQIGISRSAETEQRMENFLRVYYRMDYDMFYDILTHTMKRKDIASNDNMAFAFMEAAHKSAGAPIPENLRELTDAFRRQEFSITSFDYESLHPQPVKYIIVIGGPKIFDEPPTYSTHISGRVRDRDGRLFPRACADRSFRSRDYLQNYLADYLEDRSERSLDEATAELDTLMTQPFDPNHAPYIARFLIALEGEIVETGNYPASAVKTLDRLLEYYRPYIDNIGLLPLTVGILHLATPAVNEGGTFDTFLLDIGSAWNQNPIYQIRLMRQLRIFHGHFIDSVGISSLEEEQMSAMKRMQALFPTYEEEKAENRLFRGYNTLLGMYYLLSSVDNRESVRPNSDFARAYTSHLERTQASFKKIEKRLTASGPVGILRPMIAIWEDIDESLRKMLLKDSVAANGIYRPYIVQLSERLAPVANLEFMVNTFLPWALSDEERQNVLLMALENIGKTLENDALKVETAAVNGNIARSIILSILSHWPKSTNLQDILLDASVSPDGYLRPLWQFIASHLDDPDNLSFMTDQILPIIRNTPNTDSLLHLVLGLATRTENQQSLYESKFTLLQTALGLYSLPTQVINLRKISDLLSERVFVAVSGNNQIHAVTPTGFPRFFPYRIDEVSSTEYSIILSGRIIGEFEDATELPIAERISRSIRRAINQDDEIVPWLTEIDRDTLLLTVVADRFRDLPGMSRPVPEDPKFFPFALLTDEHRRAEDGEYPRVQLYKGETDDGRDLYGLSGFIHFAPGLYFRFDVTCNSGIQSGYTEYVDQPTRILIEKAVLSHLYEEVVNPEKLLALVERRLSNKPGKGLKVGKKNPEKRIRATSAELQTYLEELEAEYRGPAEIAEWSEGRGSFFLAISGKHGFWDYKDWKRVVDRKLIDEMMQKYRVVFIGRPVNIKSAIEVPHRGNVRVFDEVEKAAIAAGFTKPPPAHLAILPFGQHPTRANILQAGNDLFGFQIYTGAMLVPDPANNDYYAIEFYMTFKPPQPDVEAYQRAQRLAQQ